MKELMMKMLTHKSLKFQNSKLKDGLCYYIAFVLIIEIVGNPTKPHLTLKQILLI